MIKEKIIVRLLPTIKYLWLILIFLAIIWKGIIPGWEKKPADFNNYYTASKLVVEKKPIHKFYDNDWYRNQAQQIGIVEGAKFSPFPPVTAYLFVPLTFWSPITAKRIWLGFNIFLLIILPFRIRKITTWPLIKSMLFVSLFLFPISSCLNMGQLYLAIGFILLEVLGQFYLQNKPKLIGVIIGIFASIKYLPILFLGYVIKHQKKNVILFLLVLIVTIPSLIIYWIDHQSYSAFFEHFQSHLQGNLPGQGKYAIGFQSIDSMLNNLFVYDQFKNPFPSINLPILKPIIKYSLLGIIIGLMLIAFKKNRYQITPTIVSIGIIGVFVMIPASASYHFLLLLWPILCLIKWLASFKSNQSLAIISIMIFITFTIQQHHIPNFNRFPTINLLLHYPRFWGLLCVFLALIFFILKPSNKNYG